MAVQRWQNTVTSESDARVIDFAQTRVNPIADAIRMLAEQIKFTNIHVEWLHREVGELRGELGGLRTEMNARFAEMNARFDGVNQAFRDLGGEVILQANHIVNAQQDAMRAIMCRDEMDRREQPEQ